MPNVKQRRVELIRRILGHDGAPQSVVARGMAKVKKTTEQRFRELNQQHTSLARANAPLRNYLLSSLRKDPAWVASIRKLRADHKSPRIRRILPPLIKTGIREGLTFTNVVVGTRVPPFDYAWHLVVKNVSLPMADAIAIPKHGLINVTMNTGDDAGSASADAAVGIYFASPVDGVSNFSFSANPGFSSDWAEYCRLASAHSDASIGLLAVSYDWSGYFAATLVDQRISLWSNNSWIDSASGSDDTPSFPLSASFEVDSDHFYVLYVRCSMNGSADGWRGNFAGSSVNSWIGITVPSISWSLSS